jgi:hypothetical protein
MIVLERTLLVSTTVPASLIILLCLQNMSSASAYSHRTQTERVRRRYPRRTSIEAQQYLLYSEICPPSRSTLISKHPRRPQQVAESPLVWALWLIDMQMVLICRWHRCH